jgi:hypothetical protein
MIRHVVMWSLDGETTEERRAHATDIAGRLESLVPLIPELRAMEVGIDIGDEAGQFDLVLITEHDDLAGLRAYQSHPEHVRVGASFRESVASRACVDFEL